jgi:hypothetical protein
MRSLDAPRLPTLVLVFASTMASLYACGGGDEEVHTIGGPTTKRGGAGGTAGAAGNAANAKGGTSAGGSLGGNAGNAGGGTTASALSALSIEPGSVDLVITDGKPVVVSLQAIGTLPDGSKKPLAAAWSFDRFDVALIGADGKLSVNGQVGGSGTITASAGGKTASAAVHVTVKLALDGGAPTPPAPPGTGTGTGSGAGNVPGAAVSPEEKKALDAAPKGPGGLSSAAGTLVYPYDQTVFARGLLAPELMWNGGANGDAYLVSLSEPGYEAKLYTKLDQSGRFLVPQTIWDGLLASNHGEPVQVRIVRSSGGQVVGELTETWTIAQGSLRGTIYYWTVNKGQLVKIGPGHDHPELVFDSGSASDLGTPAPKNYDGTTNPPWSVGTEGKRCVACHTVSRDGSRLVGIFERQDNPASPWGTVDIAKQSVVQIGDYNRGVFQPTLTPNGSHGVVVDGSFTLAFGDATTGAELPSQLGALAGKAATPMFSPDGGALAFASEVVGGYPVEFSQSNLSIVKYDAQTLAFSAKQSLVAGNGQALAFPSFTPDAAHVVYQRGSFSRAKYGTNEHASCDLYLTDSAGSGQEVALAKASGQGHVEARNLHLAYEPRVNPIAVGGYAWVVFVSPRDYGNRMVSTTDPTYENRKQLWVAAVDLSPKPGVDPSHPAFLLRGQDLETTNMSGYWTLDPCRAEGTSCSAGYECCTGFCRTDDAGKPVCVLPPSGDMPGTTGGSGGSGGSSSGNGGGSAGTGGTNGSIPGTGSGCARLEEKCSKSGDCCDPGIACVGGFCALPSPK